MDVLRPGHFCSALLAALDASEGRSRGRKRDQTPDAIGLALRRDLLERAARADPPPQDFERWLFDHAGAEPAMARAVLDEWRLAQRMPAFAAWLAQGAPSEDRRSGG
jgi:hypothetical protein